MRFVSLLSLAILSCPFHTTGHKHKSSRPLVGGINLHPTATTTTTAFMIPSKLDDTDLWIIRTASAVATYFGLVATTDRPRGYLNNALDPSILDVRQSNVPGAGLGLFYAGSEPLRKGTVLGSYPGVVVPLQQNLGKLRAYPQCEGYTWRFGDNQFVIDPTDSHGNIQFYVGGGNPSTLGSQFLFSTLLAWWQVPTILCRINEPPKGFDVNVVTDEDSPNRCVVFSLERDVYPGEEFYIDYGPSYDRSGYGPPLTGSTQE